MKMGDTIKNGHYEGFFEYTDQIMESEDKLDDQQVIIYDRNYINMNTVPSEI